MVGNYCNLSSKKIEIIGCMTEKKGKFEYGHSKKGVTFRFK